MMNKLDDYERGVWLGAVRKRAQDTALRVEQEADIARVAAAASRVSEALAAAALATETERTRRRFPLIMDLYVIVNVLIDYDYT